jgi:hypothetical protein
LRNHNKWRNRAPQGRISGKLRGLCGPHPRTTTTTGASTPAGTVRLLGLVAGYPAAVGKRGRDFLDDRATAMALPAASRRVRKCPPVMGRISADDSIEQPGHSSQSTLVNCTFHGGVGDRRPVETAPVQGHFAGQPTAWELRFAVHPARPVHGVDATLTWWRSPAFGSSVRP